MLRDPKILEHTLAGPERAALDAFASGCRQRLGARLRRLVLFGSRARGDHHADSDIDVLAIVEGDERAARADLRHLAAEVNLAHDTSLTVLVLGEEQWATLRQRERRLPAEVERDGIEL